MKTIRELDSITVDQIAAGEVVEKPLGAVKELVENAIDAGARHITVEITDGGIRMIRVTDDGEGIAPDQVRRAFYRHATSKITSIGDLLTLSSLGFRGEALSSIAAVSRVEMITKTAEEITGIRYLVEGGSETLYEEIGAPEGTTIVVRDLFYNTPARSKFLRKPQTEGSYIAECMEAFALSRPDIAFRFISGGVDRFHTSGNGDLKENIYRIYGRDIAAQIQPVSAASGNLRITGYIGNPSINRGSRAFERFFVNGRQIKDRFLSMALEEGYREYVMQHKFPFAVLLLELPSDEVDVNVHPAKLEVRFQNSFAVSSFVTETVRQVLHSHEMIPDALLDEKEEHAEGFSFAEDNAAERYGNAPEAEPFEKILLQNAPKSVQLEGDPQENPASLLAYGLKESPVEMSDRAAFEQERNGQLRILSEEKRKQYRILGQVFETYWLIESGDDLLMMDQHAAHEKVNYERMMKAWHDKAILSQLIDPPALIELSARETDLLKNYMEYFLNLGFEIESFGEKEILLRGVPLDLYGAADEKEFFRAILDEMTEDTSLSRDPETVTSKIAGMACKASVKGNTRMTFEEIEALLDELLTLDNPYHCPHGRPTIITMSKYELDKRFHRVVG